MKSLLIPCLACCLFACMGGPVVGSSDGSGDARSDGGIGTGADGGIDAGADGGIGAGADGGIDAGCAPGPDTCEIGTPPVCMNNAILTCVRGEGRCASTALISEPCPFGCVNGASTCIELDAGSLPDGGCPFGTASCDLDSTPVCSDGQLSSCETISGPDWQCTSQLITQCVEGCTASGTACTPASDAGCRQGIGIPSCNLNAPPTCSNGVMEFCEQGGGLCGTNTQVFVACPGSCNSAGTACASVADAGTTDAGPSDGGTASTDAGPSDGGSTIIDCSPIGTAADYANTCVGQLFSCFGPTGYCFENGSSNFSSGNLDYTWSNGSAVVESTMAGLQNVTVSGVGGKACASVSALNASSASGATVQFEDADGLVIAEGYDTGTDTMQIKCGDGQNITVELGMLGNIFDCLPFQSALGNCSAVVDAGPADGGSSCCDPTMFLTSCSDGAVTQCVFAPGAGGCTGELVTRECQFGCDLEDTACATMSVTCDSETLAALSSSCVGTTLSCFDPSSQGSCSESEQNSGGATSIAYVWNDGSEIDEFSSSSVPLLCTVAGSGGASCATIESASLATSAPPSCASGQSAYFVKDAANEVIATICWNGSGGSSVACADGTSITVANSDAQPLAACLPFVSDLTSCQLSSAAVDHSPVEQ